MHRRQLILGGAASLLAGQALAHSADIGPLHIGHPWTRPALAGQNAAGYFSVQNKGTVPDVLTSVTCAAAGRTTLHRSMMMGGVMQMHAVVRVDLPAGATVTFAPGGYHVMFEVLKRRFNLGDKIPATLVFAKAGRVNVEFLVQASAPAGTPAGGGSMPGMPGM